MAEIVIIGISTILRRFLAVWLFCEIIGNRHCNHQLAKQNIQIRKHGRNSQSTL